MCVYLVLEEKHHVSWPLIQGLLQVGGELLLPDDVTGCRRRLSR